MKVSIAMATYNGAKYVEEQLRSFLYQTRQPDELIITDDCSSDQTEAIVREFTKTAPFTVEFHRNEKKLGYCGNFNAALMKTSGDLVFLSDQDDVWFPEKIEYMIGVAESNPDALAVMNDALLTDADLNSVGLTKLGQIKSAGIGIDGFVMGCCCALRRKLLDLCLPIPNAIKGHDNWLMAFADGLDGKVVDSKVLQYYRRHEFNESQFIANSTTKITRLGVLKSNISAILKNQNDEIYKESIRQNRILLLGIERADPKILLNDIKKLNHMRKVVETRVNHEEKRLALRRNKFFKKLMLALILLLNGSYTKKSNGLKSFLRDILGGP